MSRVYNFSAGPAVLPEEVLKEAADEMLDYKGSGMSVMEMSHRSKVYDNIIKEAEQDLRDLMNIPDNYKVLFLQGGASQQFAMIPMNLMKNKKAGYIVTGQWAKKAYQEASIYGEAVKLASSEDKTFSYIPDCSDLDIPDDLDYVYICVTDNNLHPWTDEAFADLGVEKPVVFDDVDGLDFEQISDCNPDVILAAYSGMTQEDYDTLSQIAPVIPYKEKAWQTSWREQTIENAEGMGMKSEGEKKVKEVEDLIAEKLEEYPQLEGIPTAFCWISADDFSTFYVYLPTDPRAAYLLDLGLTLPESVQKLAGETDDFNITVSRENADQLDDIQLMVVYGDEDLLKSLQEDKLMSQIPAIKNGAVALVDSTSALAGASTPSILSIQYEIDEYLQLLSDAAENIK